MKVDAFSLNAQEKTGRLSQFAPFSLHCDPLFRITEFRPV